MTAKSPIATKLDQEIISVLDELTQHEKTSQEYNTALERLSKLHKLKCEEAQTEFKVQADSQLRRPSADMLLMVGANIFGILWLTRYERENVISSKALGFVMKPR